MKPKIDSIDLYFITDAKLTKKTIFDDVRAAIEAGVKVVQYREKEKPTRLVCEEAKRIKELCDKNNVLFLINDRVDICLAVDADGVHLGQDDMPYETARRLLGSKVIGVTVHNANEALKAEEFNADYIGLSPIFETKTKPDAGKPGGLTLIRDVKAKVNIPIVAIGGISLGNLRDVILAGADSVAAISAIVTKDDVESECRRFIDIIKKTKRDR